MKKIKTILILAFIMLLAACKKESVDTPQTTTLPTTPPTKQEILASKTWQLTSSTISPAMMGHTDLYAMLDACEKDNTLKFSNDAAKTLVIDEGSNICSGRVAKKNTTWSLDKDEKMFSIDEMLYTLNNFSAENFNVAHSEMIDGINYTITCTYSSK